MKISVRAKGIDLTPELYNFIDLKISELGRFSSKIIDATVNLEKVTQHHHSGPFYKAVVHLRVPNDLLIGENSQPDIKMAVVQVKDELQLKLKNYKGAQKAMVKRGARVFKKLTRLFSGARLEEEEGGGGRTLEEGE